MDSVARMLGPLLVLLGVTSGRVIAQQPDSIPNPITSEIVKAIFGTSEPTAVPTDTSTPEPTFTPTATLEPTATDTPQPTATPTATLEPTVTPTGTPTPVPQCYEHEWAYLTGSMNIRERPTVNSNKAGATEQGESYRVVETHKGDTYCWLKISRGWIAHISFVSHDIADILPTIQGEDWFTSMVIRAFQYMHDRSSKWFKYTAPKIRTVVADSDLEREEVNARVQVSRRHVSINPKYARRESTAMLASTLVHEACHVHQWDRGERYLVGFLAEPECYDIEADALSAMSPGHENVKWLRCWAEHFPSQFLCKYELNPPSWMR